MPASPWIGIVTILLASVALVLAALLITVLSTCLISELRLRSRARRDYRLSRGTQQLRQLQGPLSRLERDISATQGRIDTLTRELDELNGSRATELRKALCRHLVTSRLTNVEGIGPRLRDRVVRSCFRGDLADLRNAEGVPGIGPGRQAAIVRWVEARERELPRLLRGTFPGKQQIEFKYLEQISPVEGLLAQARSELKDREALHDSARAEADKLASVRVAHFRSALRSRSPSRRAPGWYFAGIYPAWESPPEWLVTLLDRYGG